MPRQIVDATPGAAPRPGNAEVETARGRAGAKAADIKISNVLDSPPQSEPSAVATDLREIPPAGRPRRGLATLETFEKKRAARSERGAACQVMNAEALLAVFGLRPFLPRTVGRTGRRFADRRDLPADPRDRLRTGTPIRSGLATVRHRTVRNEGALSQKRAMVFGLGHAAAKTGRRLTGANRLPRVIEA